MNTLLMFSGGLDSTGVFYKLIKEKVKLYVHHINFINIENRSKAESIAVKNIIDYMNKLGEFHYSESTHELPSFDNCFMWDSDLYNLMAGSICSSVNDIEYVALGLNKSDLNASVNNRVSRGTKIFESFNVKAKKIYPLVSMTKREVYEYLPSDLRNLTWSCRRPIYENDKIFSCNRCKSCKEFNFPKQQ